MAEVKILEIVEQAEARWPLQGVTVIHRVGRIKPGANIVLVVTASSHRRAAFEAAEFLMDFLKTRAPFWKKEQTPQGARWVDAANFAKGPAHFFDGAPEHLRDAIREDVLGRVAENMRIAGLARHTPDEITELGARTLSALSMLLGWKPYLMGDKPCGTDATAFASLAGLMTPFFDSPLRQRALEFSNLVAYVDRMMARYYPEHPWQRLMMAA